MIKPKGLIETTIAMCIMNVAGFIFVDSSSDSIFMDYIVMGVICIITFFVLWFYWQGKNWARILVLLTSILALFNLIALPGANLLVASLLIIEAAFAAFMLWWLNTQQVRAYFQRVNNETKSSDEESS